MANVSPTRKGLVRDAQAGLLGLVYTGALPGAVALAANTALGGIFLGTPVIPALAVDTIVISNLVADGDLALVTQTGGNSQVWLRADASAGTLDLFGAGTLVGVISATVIEVEDNVILALGNDQDIAMVERSTTLAANTALTGVLVGTPVSAATPANSLLISNITADGDIAIFTVNAAGANSIEGLRFDASAGLTVFNEAGSDVDFRIEADTNANIFNIDAGIHAGVGIVGIGQGADGAAGLRVGSPARTLIANNSFAIMDTLAAGGTGITVPTGTAGYVTSLNLTEPNITATGTVTEASTLRIESAPTEGTRNFGFDSQAGLNRLVGNLVLSASTTAPQHSTAGTRTLSFEDGTDPAGAATNTSSIFATATVLQKINAAGTVSAIET